MRCRGRTLGVLAGLLALPLVVLVACGGSAVGTSDAGAPKPDSGGADATVETGPESGSLQDASAAEADAASADAGCVPMPVDGAPPFVPPSTPSSACTVSQIQNLYADCWATTSTTTACNNFYGDPSNSPCIRCMITPTSAPTWGPVVLFPDGYNFANLGGCLALLTGDAGAGSCAQAVESLQQCEESSCSGGCPTTQSVEAGAILSQCHEEARESTCSSPEQQVSCELDNQNSACDYADFQAAFIGIGEIMCAVGADGGADE
jgi:hypothetical protein